MASKFDAIKDKARKLIHEDALKDSHIIKERNADRAKFVMRSGAGAVATPFDNYAPSYGSNNTNVSMVAEGFVDNSQEALNNAMDAQMQAFLNKNQSNSASVVMKPSQMPEKINKRLPSEIIESFSKNFINENEMPILDRLGVTDGYQKIEPQNTIQPTLTENASNVGKIDYELIKTIVEGTVKKYMSAATKKLLNEQKSLLNENGNIAALQFTGDKFVLITKGGDLYEAKMEYKKNINKK